MLCWSLHGGLYTLYLSRCSMHTMHAINTTLPELYTSALVGQKGYLALLGPQSRFGDNYLQFEYVAPT